MLLKLLSVEDDSPGPEPIQPFFPLAFLLIFIHSILFLREVHVANANSFVLFPIEFPSPWTFLSFF